MVLTFFGKMLDDLLFSFTGILTYKNKKVAASIVRGMNTFIFFYIVAEVLNDSNLQSILIISIASSIGRYLGFTIDKLLVKDTPFHAKISYKGDKKDLQPMINKLRDLEYDVHTSETFYEDKVSSLGVEILSETRKDSALIESLVPDEAHVSFWEVKKMRKGRVDKR